MSGTLQALGVLAEILGIVFGTMLVLTVGFMFFLDIWAKRTTVGRIYCFFLEQRNLSGRLLKTDSGKVFMGKGEDKEEYLLDHTRQFWTWWPPGLPKFIQVPVRSHFYIRHNPEPFDPENLEAMISTKSLRIISDEAMLRQTWKDVRESTGVRGAVRNSASSWVLILVFATLAVVAFNAYTIMELQTAVTDAQQSLDVILKVMGK